MIYYCEICNKYYTEKDLVYSSELICGYEDYEEEENAYQSMDDDEVEKGGGDVEEDNPKTEDKKDERQYKVGTKFSVKNPFIETTDNYEVTNVGKDYVGIVGPGGVFQRILKEDFEEQFFNKRLILNNIN